ncbi:MAG: hypothetical protein ACR2OV_00080 [Hyphomicrobiaceae bacterium]
MTDLTPIECEARLVGLSKQRRKDGDWVEVKFHIHPDDHPAALFILPLGTQCMLGVKGMPENDEDTTTAEQTQEQPKGDERATAMWSEAKRKIVQRAALVCKETAFQQSIANGYRVMWDHPRHADLSEEERAAYYVRTCCGVTSRADIDPAEESGARFRDLMRWYEASQHGQLPEQMESMR